MSYMLHPDEPALLKTLKDNGYFVWWGGKNDLVPAQNGFDGYCSLKYTPPAEETAKPRVYDSNPDWHHGDNYYSFHEGLLLGDVLSGEYTGCDWDMVRGAVDFIGAYEDERPFCIYLPLNKPHVPYSAADPWFSLIDRTKVPTRAPIPEQGALEPSIYNEIRDFQKMQNWSEEQWGELQATYYASCAEVDHMFGMVLEALRGKGAYDETAVFFFADHGDFAGDHGVVQKVENVFPDGLARVPFVIKPPAGVPVRPRVSDALVELIDFPATVEAMTGIAPSHTHFGKSLLPVLSGQMDEHRDAVFCEGGRRYGEESCKGLELVDEPAEENPYWPTLRPNRIEGPAMGKAVMLRTLEFKYVHRLYEADELYDLRSDPQEVVNRINDPELRDVLEQLRSRMMEFYLETTDVVPPEVDARTESSIERAQQFNQRQRQAPPAGAAAT